MPGVAQPENWSVDPTHKVQRYNLMVDKRHRVALAGLLAKIGHDVLLVMREVGCVRVVSWKQFGTQVQQRARMADDETAQKILARYERAHVEDSGRLTLSIGARSHLGVEAGRVMVWTLPNAVEIWSPAFRAASLAESHPQLDDLP